MNIKSNKQNKKSFKFLEGKWIQSNLYLIIPLVILLIIPISALLEASWGIIVTLTIIGVFGQFGFVLFNELGRLRNVRYYDGYNENHNYGQDRFNWFSLVGLPLIMLFGTYSLGIKPMIYDFKNAERIDKIIPMEKNTTLYYNDNNHIFILLVENVKQPLVIDFGGSSDTYNRIKASYLDNKIKVVKKEEKSWIDDESSILYDLDGHSFK